MCCTEDTQEQSTSDEKRAQAILTFIVTRITEVNGAGRTVFTGLCLGGLSLLFYVSHDESGEM